jgi:hypothetical protein
LESSKFVRWNKLIKSNNPDAVVAYPKLSVEESRYGLDLVQLLGEMH